MTDREKFYALDKKLAEFRVVWNREARKDIKFAMKVHRSAGKQSDLPEWWYRDVSEWRALKTKLGIG